MTNPRYSARPIRSLAALSEGLRFNEEHLQHIAAECNSLWRLVDRIEKSDGSVREVWDANSRLKAIHKAIASRIFCHIEFPPYITGSRKGCDYIANARMHVGQRILIKEDIKTFFPTTSAELVWKIWRHFFGFSGDVADLLTALVTKDGCLPQGGVCSSHLANLAFWDIEPAVVNHLSKQGFKYSRYVDDVCFSHSAKIGNEEKANAISTVMGMFRKRGYEAGRSKHKIETRRAPLTVTRLVVNNKVSLPKAERSKLRAMVYALETRIMTGAVGPEVAKELNSLAGRVGIYKKLHPNPGGKLAATVKKLREYLNNSRIHNTTLSVKPIADYGTTDAPF